MRLYLVQHGQAKSREQDPERHLSDNGLQDVLKAVQFFEFRPLTVDAIWHSGKTRAEQTAQMLISSFPASQGLLQHEGLAPNDPVDPIVKELSSLTRDMMIVGHMPFVGKLASALVAGDESAEVIAFQQSAIACLERDEVGSWSLGWMVIPEILPEGPF